MKLFLITLLLTSCSLRHEYNLQPGRKFTNGKTVGSTLFIQSRKANNEPPEIILFQDGQGNDFTIYER